MLIKDNMNILKVKKKMKKVLGNWLNLLKQLNWGVKLFLSSIQGILVI